MTIVNDRIPVKPNRKKITNESTGTVEYATVEYADNPTVVGTPINKALFDQVQFWDIQEEEASKYQDFYQAYLPAANPLECLFVTSANTLLGITDNKVYRSVDEGLSWNEIILPSGISTSNTWTRYSFAEHAGIIVGCSSGGEVIYSNDDGVTWSYVYVNYSYDLVSMCYFNGMWIAGAESGYCVKSSNLTDWTAQKIGGSDILYIFTNNTQAIAVVSDSTGCYTSNNGNDWSTEITIPGDIYNSAPSVTYFKDKWISISRNTGYEDTTKIYCSTSQNGSEWETLQIFEVSGDNNPTFIISGDDFLVFIGRQIFKSEDLEVWEEVANFGNSSSDTYFYFDNRTIEAVSSNKLYLCIGRNEQKNILYYTDFSFSTKKILYVKNNEENIFGQECVMSYGNYVGTGSPQVIVFDFTPKVIFLASSFSSTTLSYPYSGATGSGYSPDYLWGENSFVAITDYIASGRTYYFLALG